MYRLSIYCDLSTQLAGGVQAILQAACLSSPIPNSTPMLQGALWPSSLMRCQRSFPCTPIPRRSQMSGCKKIAPSNSKYYIHYIPEPTCRGSAPLYVPPLGYKRGGMQRYKGTDTLGHTQAHLDLAQAHLDLAQAHKFKQAQYITQWSRVLHSDGPNHSKLLRVLEFIVLLPTGKTLKPPPHLRIRAGAFRHPAGDFPLRQT
jgi:hypothetical protein